MSLVSNLPGQITVVTAPSPSVELASPFNVGSDGRIAEVSDPVKKAAQHLIDIALTAPGERVMRPNYGVGLSHLVFENASISQFQAAAQRLQSAFSVAESGVSNIQVSVMQTYDQKYLFQVSFTLDQSPIVHQAVFDYAGNLVGTT